MNPVVLSVHRDLRAKNNEFAQQNRTHFHERQLFVINVLSSPGSGKTELLFRTMCNLKNHLRAAVIVGDLATDNDAKRLEQAGVPVVQLTTGTVCHLEAAMVARGCEILDLNALDLLVIENVGNLVCPAGYDLGEDLRVVLLSVTEGEDKPLKYPTMFRTANVVLITKTDLAEATGFQRAIAMENIRKVAPEALILEVSARDGNGMSAWEALLINKSAGVVRRSASQSLGSCPNGSSL